MAALTTMPVATALNQQRAASQQQPRALRAAFMAPVRRAGRQAGRAVAPVASAAPLAKSLKDDVETRYLTERANHVTTHFNSALGIDDFIARTEILLNQFGFGNENTIACVNLCRDEVTHTLLHKINQVYGMSFSTHGLGGVLTCGVTGMGAGLSHSPVAEGTGKERYIFFSFPHIGIDSKGVVGNISRPGRAQMSCACGAVIKALGEIKRDGLIASCREPGLHDPIDPEYSILKQRLARRLEFEGHTDASIQSNLDLVALTKTAEATVTSDLEFMIAKAVDVNKADYAVITGVQIHNWAQQFDDDEPNLEFVAPVNAYVVVDGKKTVLDLNKVPALTPRQIRVLASAPDAHAPAPAEAASMLCNTGGASTLREIDPPYMYNSKQARKQIKERLQSMAELTAGAPALEGAKDSKLLINA